MPDTTYPEIRLHVAGDWLGAETAENHVPVINPATGSEIGRVPVATEAMLDAACAASVKGFAQWRATSTMERSAILRRAAALLRERADDIGRSLTLEQGRPLADTRMECLMSADIIDWNAEEVRRTYGRVIPARVPGVRNLVIKEPIGPVAAFTTWNVPVNHAARKLSAALAAGCSVVLKGPEEAPAATMGVVRCFLDAGVPADALSLVFGNPPQISGHLIPNPAIRMITFTGSTAIGKLLAGMAGAQMKKVVMELGGHAPAIVMADADLGKAVEVLSMTKFRNAGQICISPSRFLIETPVFDRFTDAFVEKAEALVVGDGLDPASQVGPLSTHRRIEEIERLVQDAVDRGAKLRTGGKRLGNSGYFYAPTVLTDVPRDAAIMNEEPFGPVAIVNRIHSVDEAIAEANRLDYGLAAYAYTGSNATAEKIASGVESGMVSINHHGLALPELPFGGVKDSGYGSEGGQEAAAEYMVSKFVSHAP
ncbi:MAG: NAD-dependent succinate-semialdehyde dehydrogenase [Maritimibacter sp.]|nr:NAD-dependent succinate-semialdehyde dehydrogenase [Maritimibacter sp.]